MTEQDRIRREIERTQSTLGADVNALTEKVSPGRIMERRVGRVRDAAHRAKDAVMGGTTEYATKVGNTAGSLASTARESTADHVSSTAESVSEVPQAISRGTRGNPLAAGLIAFGAGWLVSSLLPASDPERRLADQATGLAQEHLQPMVHQVADELKDSLSEPVKQAAESVKSEAADAASTVTDEAQSATGDITGRAQEAQQNLRS